MDAGDDIVIPSKSLMTVNGKEPVSYVKNANLNHDTDYIFYDDSIKNKVLLVRNQTLTYEINKDNGYIAVRYKMISPLTILNLYSDGINIKVNRTSNGFVIINVKFVKFKLFLYTVYSLLSR